jgi:hypothetical protein
LAVWQDVRAANGAASRIYAQRLSRAGSPQGENFKVNGTLANGGSPSVAVDGAGTFFVVWHTTCGTGSIDLPRGRGLSFSKAGLRAFSQVPADWRMTPARHVMPSV